MQTTGILSVSNSRSREDIVCENIRYGKITCNGEVDCSRLEAVFWRLGVRVCVC